MSLFQSIQRAAAKTAARLISRGTFAFVLAGAACFPGIGCERPKPEERVLLEVNEETVTLGAFRADFARIAPSLGDPPEGSQRLAQEELAYLERTIEEKLVEQEAERLGLRVLPERLQEEIDALTASYEPHKFEKMLVDRNLDRKGWEERVRRRLLAEVAVEKVLGERAQPSDEECREYYEQNITEFARPKEVRARQIVVDSEAKADELRKQLLRGADFAELAVEHSQSPDAKDGGDLGYFSAGHMPPEFDRVVFSLRPRTVSKVVLSPYGFHLFWVEDVREPRTLAFEEVQDGIRERLRRRRMAEEYKAWVRELRGKARIEIHEELLGK